MDENTKGQHFYLSDYLSGRDNNFNIIRMIAASAVLVSHSYPLTQGPGVDEPLDSILGFSLGLLAVYSFFILSGFLVTNSLYLRGSVRVFFKARALRILPGLFVAVTLCAFVLGPIFTSQSAGEYFSTFETYSYIVRNLTFIQLQFNLPYTFESNIYPGAINGSLWTLPYEVYCYVSLAAVGAIGLLSKRHNFILLLLAYLGLWLVLLYIPLPHSLDMRLSKFLELAFCFISGIGAFIYRDKIPLNWRILVLLAAICLFAYQTIVFRPIFIIALGYLLLWISYIPSGWVRSYNKLGDYSYGIYIYAFPIQQTIMHLYADISLGMLMVSAFFFTLLCSIASWHLIEKPALQLKNRPILSSVFKHNGSQNR